MKHRSLLFRLLMCTLWVSPAYLGDLDYDDVHIVDHHRDALDNLNVNLIARSNRPGRDHELRLDLLLEYIVLRAQEAGIAGLWDLRPLNHTTDVYYYIYNLLDPKTMDHNAEWSNREKQYFDEYPQEGFYINHADHGVLKNPSDYDGESFETMVKTFPMWYPYPQDWMVDKMYNDSRTHDMSRLKIAVIHCNSGHDRTGQVAGGYYLKYLHMSLFDSLMLTDELARKPQGIRNHERWALGWYGCWLDYAANRSLESCRKDWARAEAIHSYYYALSHPQPADGVYFALSFVGGVGIGILVPILLIGIVFIGYCLYSRYPSAVHMQSPRKHHVPLQRGDIDVVEESESPFGTCDIGWLSSIDCTVACLLNSTAATDAVGEEDL